MSFVITGRSTKKFTFMYDCKAVHPCIYHRGQCLKLYLQSLHTPSWHGSKPREKFTLTLNLAQYPPVHTCALDSSAEIVTLYLCPPAANKCLHSVMVQTRLRQNVLVPKHHGTWKEFRYVRFQVLAVCVYEV